VCTDLLHPGLLIAGEWRDSGSAGTMEHINPATGRTQCIFPAAGASEVDEAVCAARRGLEAFRKWSPVERAHLMRRIGDALLAAADEFATISILEAGMVRSMAVSMAPRAATWFHYYAGWTDKIGGSVYPGASGFDYTRAEPHGVAAIILTWNSPTSTIGMKVAAAMAAGCAIVLKPPELAPFSANRFAEICLEAGAPAELMNIVCGGPDAGEALVSHPGVDKISFTGGIQAARAIQAASARHLTPLTMELGGKSASLIFDDVDPATVGEASAMGIARMSGQACVAPTRVLVHEDLYESVVDNICRSLRDVVVGDPSDPKTVMGPVISQRSCERILETIDRARADGDGELILAGGREGGDLQNGYFLRPTVFGQVDPHSGLAQEEVFGPVLAMTPFHDEEEAIAMANSTPYALAAYVHTSDVSRVHRLAAELDAGNISVNGGLAQAGPYAPFGGFKSSGYGKEGGLEGILEFTRIKNVNIAL
jgi:aldehyde dehydrogenase (NAD+)